MAHFICRCRHTFTNHDHEIDVTFQGVFVDILVLCQDPVSQYINDFIHGKCESSL